MNNLILIAEIIVAYGMLLLSKRLFGKEGIYGWIALFVVVAQIETLKQATLLGIDTTLGSVLFASTFLATDMLNENYGADAAKKGIRVAIFSVITFNVLMQMALLYAPNSLDFSQEAMETIFGFVPRISIASLIMYAVASFCNVRLFNAIKKKTGGKYLWLRNNVSTIVCNSLENFGFAYLAFGGVYSTMDCVMIAVGTSVIEILLAVVDTPFLYASKHIGD